MFFSVDELLLTEMIFNGIFTELSVDYCVALLSCFVSEERTLLQERSFDTTIKRSLELVTVSVIFGAIQQKIF